MRGVRIAARVLAFGLGMVALPGLGAGASAPGPVPVAPVVPLADRLDALRHPAAGFTCADVSCKLLVSCEEACHKLIVCGQSIRDRDHDGIPCENLCFKPCPR